MSGLERDLVAEEQASRLSTRRGSKRPRPDRGDDGTRRLVIAAGCVGAVLVATVGGWTLLGSRPSGLPVLEPPAGPVRVKPLDPGGMRVMSAQVAQVNGTGSDALAPAPEQAAPQALQAEVDAARKSDQPSASERDHPAEASSPGAAAPPSASAAGAARIAEPSSPAPARPAAPVAAPPATVAHPDRAAAEDEPAHATTTPPPAAEGHAVQLAALDSEPAAQKEWQRLGHQSPGLFASRVPSVVEVSRNGKRFFRLRTAGFGTVAEATAFCVRAHAAGIACTLADF